MIFGHEKQLKDEVIAIGRKLSDMRMVAGRSGNLSCRLDKDVILITATGTALGDLRHSDIIRVDLNSEADVKNPRLTTEFPLHSLIYKNFNHQAILHCHPALINGYFAVTSDVKALTFESKLYLGEIPVVKQDTPAVTRPQEVIDALKTSNLVVLKNHGVVGIAATLKEALYLIETLEESIRSIALARIFKNDLLDELDKELKQTLSEEVAYPMFSKEHIQAIVGLVNKDEFILKKGQELDLTLKLAIKLDGTDKVFKFNFEKGKVVSLDFDADAPFVVSAGIDPWEMVFLGKLDPFVAVTQGKMKLQGNLGQLSRWYVPFTRLFELFRKVKIK